MVEEYKYLRKTGEFSAFCAHLQRVLSQRGKRRAQNIKTLEQHFLRTWSDAQTLHLAQYKELMTERRELKSLVEKQEHEISTLEKQNDILRERLLTK